MESTEAEFDMNCPVSDRGRFGAILAVEGLSCGCMGFWIAPARVLDIGTRSPPRAAVTRVELIS